MANSKVALLRYIRIARGWRRFRVPAIRRGRGWDERISPPGGAEILERSEFQLRWYQGIRRDQKYTFAALIHVKEFSICAFCSLYARRWQVVSGQ